MAEEKENPYECNCWYDPHEILENKITVQLKFVDCEPKTIDDFGYIFRTVQNLPRIGEIVCDSRMGIVSNDLKHQYKVVDIRSYSFLDVYKIFYLKQMSSYKKEKKVQKILDV